MIDAPMSMPTVPHYGEGSLADLACSLLASLGVGDEPNPLGLPGTGRACLLIVDGLGWELLRAHPAAAPFLSELAVTGRAVTAGFPATTVTSLTSLGTGLAPGMHGMLGYQVAVFLPRDFNLKEFLVKSTGQQVAGYYDFETKTISLLNWVPPDRQEPILAHELTHALQDQNYDLGKWMKAARKPAGNSSKHVETGNDDGATARKAVVEGQAMVVYVDYLLAPMGRNLVNTPDLIYQMEEPAVKAVADSQMLHDAPMILRESGSFAYNEGLIFEGELLHKGGREMAFAGAFARPPRNSHEILQPQAYISEEKLQPVAVPDLKPLLGEQYDVYDSGGI